MEPNAAAVFGLSCVAASACAGSKALRSPEATAEVRAAVIEWNVGINQEAGPSPLVETILPATLNGRRVWRVVHRDADPTGTDSAAYYDLYDVDRATLNPVRGIMSRPRQYLGLTFDADSVTIVKRDGHSTRLEKLGVRNPMPEGPGLSVLLGSLPLRPGFRTSFLIVDRWDEPWRVKEIDLVVGSAMTIETPLGRCDVFEVTLAPHDGSFRIRDWVRARPPHYPLRTEYVRGDETLVSEVVRMVLGAD